MVAIHTPKARKSLEYGNCRYSCCYAATGVKLVATMILAARITNSSVDAFLVATPINKIYGSATSYHWNVNQCVLKQEELDSTDNCVIEPKSSSSDNANSCTPRRTLILSTMLSTTTTILPTTWLSVQSAQAAGTAITTTPSPSLKSTAAFIMSPEKAVVTDKVFFKVRISRSDGTFYTRDDLPDTPENQVFTGRLVIGLFGKNAPNHVSRFLQYVTSDSKPLDDAPYPSYSRSVFPQFDQGTGLLHGGSIPSLEVTEIQGTGALKYGGRLFPSKLWIDVPTESAPKISHTAIGLLTHEQLDVTPNFEITTRTDTSYLDRTHTVFGKLLLDETSVAFLKRVAELPTYSIDRPATSATIASSDGSIIESPSNPVLEEAAGAIFNAQRDFFRGAAKSFGDTRVSKLYEGKLLRRVEVTQVGIL